MGDASTATPYIKSPADYGEGVDYAAIVIGTGFSGLRMLHELRKLGLSVKVFEKGSKVGGAWYWNNYPGARTDTECWTYILSFSKEIKAEWTWTERYPSQPEVQAYLNFVADRCDMHKDIQFNTAIVGAKWDESTRTWTVLTATGASYTCRFFIPATGALSGSLEPPFPGLNTFQGEWYKTSDWPKDKTVDFLGKRVAVVGTGATGVQVVPIVAHSAASVTVFQRTPNYVLPGRNFYVPEPMNNEVKRNYDQVWGKAMQHVFGFPFDKETRTLASVPDDEERRQILEAGWEAGGFRYVYQTFEDLFYDAKSNEMVSEFVRQKIRAIVKDPKTADLLCPRYPIMAKRPPSGHFYYESFNRPNVSLVDISDSPITEVTKTGLRTATNEYDFDIIIFAVGFDVATGGLTRIDIQGLESTLKEDWGKSLTTYMGVGVSGYPNMFLVAGPHAPASNVPVAVDVMCDWIGKEINYMAKHGYTRIEPSAEAQNEWCKKCASDFEGSLLAKASEEIKSWYIGANVPGKPYSVLLYFGGLQKYLVMAHDEEEAQYPAFRFS
ncbi:hypothetical protein H2204_000369 [Knufia peltigerae]|uniref:FAD/NAD(P)-binding domain-containing protein n=1 Tax=Knufia peltigerae TaxID=1002370 RepID=A0AA38YFY2_9EURO|nr:hypothetical protein H2204_000369 [Knufia peltigerae]